MIAPAGMLLPFGAALAAALVVLLWWRVGDVTTLADSSRPGRQDPGSDTGADQRPATTFAERWRRLRRRMRLRGAQQDRAVELQVLDGLAAALEAGLPVPQAVTLALARVDGAGPTSPGPTAAGWGELTRAAQEGQALAPVWHRLARRSGSPTLASVARAWQVAALTGAPIARAIRVSAHAARERRRLERAVDVATAGARATVTVLTLLPLAGVGLAAVLGVSPAALYSHPVALASALGGTVLVLLGQLWSRRMVARVLGGAR